MTSFFSARDLLCFVGCLDKDKIIASKDKEIAELKKKTRDFDTLKNQAASQAAEYNRLADRYNKLTGEKPADKKAD